MKFRLDFDKYPFLSVAREAAKELNQRVFLVGGFVRDVILKREGKEIDFLISADPEINSREKSNEESSNKFNNGINFAENFAKKLGVKKVSIFKNFGTAHFNFMGYDLEFVGARKESYRMGSRKPYVWEGSFEDDIKRRDFTINTLAVSLNEVDFGEIIDTYNGLEDIKKKIIKTPLDPFQTFNDDPLRILRAYRFASQLNFNVDEKINKASNQLRDRLKIISQERITDEFLKILESSKPSVGLKLLFDTGVLETIFPEIANLAGVEQRKDYHHKDVFLHTLIVVDKISEVTEDVWLRFAALVHDIAKPQTKKFVEETGWTFHGHDEVGAKMMKGIFKRLKLPLHKLGYVEKLVRLHLRPIALAGEEVTDSAIRRLIFAAGEDLHDLITLCRADITSKNPRKVSRYLENYESVMKKVLEVEEKDRLKKFQSPVRGEVIMQVCNLKPSKKVGEIKSAIEEAILDGKIGNNYEEAYEYLLKIKEKYLQSEKPKS